MTLERPCWSCLHAIDVLVVAGAGIVGYPIRNGLFSLPPPYWAHIVIGYLTFGLVVQIAGMYRFAALHHRSWYRLINRGRRADQPKPARR